VLYPACISEFVRVLRPPNGRAVLLTTERNLLCHVLSKHGKRLVFTRHRIVMGGGEAHLFELKLRKEDAGKKASASESSGKRPSEAAAVDAEPPNKQARA